MSRAYAVGIAALVIVAIAGAIYVLGGSKPRATVKALESDVATLEEREAEVAESISISRETAVSVDVAEADIRKKTRSAQEAIRERIEVAPLPSAPIDPVVLYEANEAYDRAIRAACRVQRTSECGDSAAAADRH